MTCCTIVKENDPETLMADAGRLDLKVSVRGFDEVTDWRRSVQGFAGPAAVAPGQLDFVSRGNLEAFASWASTQAGKRIHHQLAS